MSGHAHGPKGGGCRAVFERLSEYIDGELADDLCSHIDGHMDDCPRCREFLDSLRRTVRLVEGIDAPPMPDEIRRAVLDAYRRYRGGVSRR